MRLVHLSDLHLGFRQYHRQTPAGINQREADVAQVFAKVIDRIIALSPDLVLIAGDVFHTVRPPNPAILQAFTQLSRLRAALPEALVIMVAGNHDVPRSTETGCILRLFAPMGVHVVDAEPRRLSFPERNLSVLAVPDVPGLRPSFDPDPGFAHNVLVMHGDAPGSLPDTFGYTEQASLEFAPEDIGFSRWSYVALGHHHIFHQLANHVCWSGAMEYASVNVWGELAEEISAKLPGKRFVEYDLEKKKRILHTIPTARRLIDLPWITAQGMTAGDVDDAIRANVAGWKGGIDDCIVRQVVRDIPRHVARELDHKQLRDLRRRALHFHLDTRRPDLLRPMPVSGEPGRRPSLMDMVRDRLWTRQLTPDIDRQALVDLALHYVREADARETAVAAAAAVEGE
jgi:exonuclease SbcD